MSAFHIQNKVDPQESYFNGSEVVRNPLFRGGKQKKHQQLHQHQRQHKHIHKNLQVNPRSKSEATVIRHLEQLTGKPFPTVIPSWLGYELDGYNEELGIALEFSGPLHTKWTPTFESYEKYFERVRRDRYKLEKCAEHGVKLIVVDMSLPQRHWRDYVASRLYDYGVRARPLNYIDVQTAIPFRNEQIERELGLRM